MHTFRLFSLICLLIWPGKALYASTLQFGNEQSYFPKAAKHYLLPADHPLQERLRGLFVDPQMFRSPVALKRAGFNVLPRVHRSLMVASHPLLSGYLIKVFLARVPSQLKLKSYIKRIQGAQALRAWIQSERLQQIVVPHKWLYRLPIAFSDPITHARTYILIAEKIDLCSGGKEGMQRRYRQITPSLLEELCRVIFRFRGLDSTVDNMVFTNDGKIAFIDTERWQKKRKHVLYYVLPHLMPHSQKQVKAIWQRFIREQ